MTIRGMYGLPQSGLLAKHGYYQSKYIPGLWKHEWRPVQFTLVVDNFGVKYVGKEHALHLKQALEQDYTVTTEWKGGDTLASPSTGTTNADEYIYQCRDM
jgi:hypothetical protein